MSVVIPSGPTPPERLSSRTRLNLVVVGLCLLTLLLVAAWLRPDPQGLGTHRQLGLPPCTVKMLFNMRCPTCGMTTAWSHVMHGQWPTALRTNVGGTLLAIAALAGVPWLLVSATRGRWWFGRPTEFTLAVALGLVVAISLVEWILRLTAG
jgi:hypothetical protein